MPTTKKSTTTKKTVVAAPARKPAKKPVSKTPTAVAAPSPAAAIGRSRFIHKNLKVSPRKLRLLVNTIKVLAPSVALTRLKFTNTNASRQLQKCLKDAISSAAYNSKLDQNSLRFAEIRVDEGMKIKRMDKGHGSRFARGIIQKRHSRLFIALSGTILS